MVSPTNLFRQLGSSNRQKHLLDDLEQETPLKSVNKVKGAVLSTRNEAIEGLISFQIEGMVTYQIARAFFI
jgi:hypothetical protein